MSDPFTLTRRLCDDDGMVSEELSTDDPSLTYIQQTNILRAHTSLPPVEPFACTGSAHLAAEHIFCTSKAHEKKPTDEVDWSSTAPIYPSGGTTLCP